MLNPFILLIPELSLLGVILFSQLYAVFSKSSSRLSSLWTIVLTLALALWYANSSPVEGLGFNGTFFYSPIVGNIKALILGLAAMSMVLYRSHNIITKKEFKAEFFSLLLLSSIGIFIAISARDFILLYCGLELQALASYALAAFSTRSDKSSEAGLKYFILGGLVSCIMLFGMSLIYGFAGSLKFSEVNSVLIEADYNIGLVIGLVFVLAGLLFKLSAAPLHIWTPDVYEGSPISAVSFFAVAQKLGNLIVLTNFILIAISSNAAIMEIIKISAILSMLIGSLGGVGQVSLKRLMAYSTVMNIGYVLVGVYIGGSDGFQAAYLYMIIYIISAIGFFASLIALFGDKSDIATFEDLNGIAATRKTLAVVISLFMFSMIGLPPLAGFFGKYIVFIQAIKAEEYLLALIGISSSVIAAFYYLKAVKAMYFNQPQDEFRVYSTNKGLASVTAISVIYVVGFVAFAIGLKIL